ncbi:precorrin-3B synthase [Rhodococcus sp. HM1]|uniref:precorrin-3B synthase n=1 Tax=Rhodococcus sp. HM1 TaxID=2937759 RepID=UPI00200ABBC4|nr:precorrin-3B synthase [Rhodococcus sp. HM1]MCK8675477.1 precorrin-3B synthase [Rhodococcus sp. HM1]
MSESRSAVDVHLPGGALTAAQLQALAELAHAHGDAELLLTDHAGLRMHGDRDTLTGSLHAAGLTVHGAYRRSVVASPLSGRIGGLADVRAIAAELHRRLHGTAATADTVLGVDDGSGDIVALSPDVAVCALPDGSWMLTRGGRDTGVRVETGDVVDVLLEPADATAPDTDTAPLPTPPPHPIGWLDRADGTVVLAAALAGGVLPARTAEFLAAVERPVVITPWRSLLLCDLDEWAAEQVVRVLAPMGLIFDADSPHVE